MASLESVQAAVDIQQARIYSNSIPPYPAPNPPTGPEAIPAAIVTIGEVPITDNLGKFLTEDNGANVFLDYRVMNRYEKDFHRYMLGITSPQGFQGNRAAFVQLASPTLLWIADWTVSKSNSVPTIPDPTPPTSNWIQLDEQMEPANMSLAADGVTPIYRISGVYVYGCLNPSFNLYQDITFPKPPWMGGNDLRSVGAFNLQQGIINNNQGGIAGTGVVPPQAGNARL